MKVTTDRKYLMEVIDKADYAEIVARSHMGESAEWAKYDFFTITHYFVYLATRALEDWKFAKNLDRTLADVQTHPSGKLRMFLHCLADFVHTGRWVMYNSKDGPSIVERIWNVIRRLTGFSSWESMKELKKDFESFMGCEMKFTTDVEFLKKVIDRTSYVERAHESVGKEEAELIEDDLDAVFFYLNWLGVKALESKEHAENMINTFKELMEYPPSPILDTQITYLYNFVGQGHAIKYGPDNKSIVENLARDFDEFFNRLKIDKIREFKKKLLEYQRTKSKLKKVRRQAEERSEKEDENVMYG